MARAGMPATRVAAGTSRLTTAPAATTAPSPTVTPIGHRRGVTSRQEARVRPDHRVVSDLDAAHVVQRAPVIDEHVGADPELEPWSLWIGGTRWKRSSIGRPVSSDQA